MSKSQNERELWKFVPFLMEWFWDAFFGKVLHIPVSRRLVKLDEIGIFVVDLKTARAFTSDLIAFEGVGTGKMNIRKTKSVEVGNDFSFHYKLDASILYVPFTLLLQHQRPRHSSHICRLHDGCPPSTHGIHTPSTAYNSCISCCPPEKRGV